MGGQVRDVANLPQKQVAPIFASLYCPHIKDGTMQPNI
jgi:hypothetical protein